MLTELMRQNVTGGISAGTPAAQAGRQAGSSHLLSKIFPAGNLAGIFPNPSYARMRRYHARVTRIYARPGRTRSGVSFAHASVAASQAKTALAHEGRHYPRRRPMGRWWAGRDPRHCGALPAAWGGAAGAVRRLGRAFLASGLCVSRGPRGSVARGRG